MGASKSQIIKARPTTGLRRDEEVVASFTLLKSDFNGPPKGKGSAADEKQGLHTVQAGDITFTFECPEYSTLAKRDQLDLRFVAFIKPGPRRTGSTFEQERERGWLVVSMGGTPQIPKEHRPELRFREQDVEFNARYWLRFGSLTLSSNSGGAGGKDWVSAQMEVVRWIDNLVQSTKALGEEGDDILQKIDLDQEPVTLKQSLGSF